MIIEGPGAALCPVRRAGGWPAARTWRLFHHKTTRGGGGVSQPGGRPELRRSYSLFVRCILSAMTSPAALLRAELSERARAYAGARSLPYCVSYGEAPTVCFEEFTAKQHGNFYPANPSELLLAGAPGQGAHYGRAPSAEGRERMAARTGRVCEFRRAVDECVLPCGDAAVGVGAGPAGSRRRPVPGIRVPGAGASREWALRSDRSGHAPGEPAGRGEADRGRFSAGCEAGSVALPGFRRGIR